MAYVEIKAKKASGYSCPVCQEFHNDSDEYDVEGKTYPQYFNESRGSTPDGNFHDWDELHKCEKCKVEFWFTNGAY